MKPMTFNTHVRKPLPKPEPVSSAVSWWIAPEYQTSREAFQKKLVDGELTRLKNSRFGGASRFHDSGMSEASTRKRRNG